MNSQTEKLRFCFNSILHHIYNSKKYSCFFIFCFGFHQIPINLHSFISTFQVGKISLTSFSSNKSGKHPLMTLRVSSSFPLFKSFSKQFLSIDRSLPCSNGSKVKVFSFGHPSIMSPIMTSVRYRNSYLSSALFSTNSLMLWRSFPNFLIELNADLNLLILGGLRRWRRWSLPVPHSIGISI